MSLPVKSLGNNKDAKPSIPSKATLLNPNAAEFIPSSVRPANGSNIAEDICRKTPGTSRKVALDRIDSAATNTSDDDVHQYWEHKLPDDITPDFTATEEMLTASERVSFEGLSIHDVNQALRFPSSPSSRTLDAQLTKGLTGNLGYSGSVFPENQLRAFNNSDTDIWGNQFVNADEDHANGFEGHHFNGTSSVNLVNNLYGDSSIMEDSAIKHVEFLALQFPGFSAENLADIYCANGCDLNMTIEILTQLELQFDGGFIQNLNSKATADPSLTILDFPAFPGADAQNVLSKYSKDNMQQTQNLYRSSLGIFHGAPDFSSAIRKLSSQGRGTWKYERSDPTDAVGGSNGNSHLLNSSWKIQGKSVSGKKFQGFGSSRSSPIWLETGEAVGANMYSASRLEARDYACLRNACFQQVREAYMIGNKALAKELGDKGKWYNLQMREAHAKAREAIYRHRNPIVSEIHDHWRGPECMIDLHGLHVNEALHVLKHELGVLKNVAKSGGRLLHALICTGTGHHTKGARTPARLPIAIEQYLLEEGLHYTQPQPGLLRVAIH